MAKSIINIGTVPNDGTGDTIRDSFNKANLNFTELYNGLGISDTPTSNSSFVEWDVAYSWGDHSTAGYLTAETDPVFIASPASNITTSNISQWTDAYNWGDHAAAGYINTTQDVIPAINNLYDLGSNTNRFKDLYLSGSSLYLGDAVITSSNTAVSIPYTPANSNNWANTAPTTVEEALDRIAAAIGPIA
jgi:hypothetical protein